MRFVRRIEKRFGEDIIWICTKGITGGDVLDGRIIKAIENAEIILCMVNKDFADSPECEREVLLSRQKNKFIIPILFEELDWPLKKSDGTPSNMQLAFAQRLYVNMYDTAKKKEEFGKLMKTIGKELGLTEQGTLEEIERQNMPSGNAEGSNEKAIVDYDHRPKNSDGMHLNEGWMKITIDGETTFYPKKIVKSASPETENKVSNEVSDLEGLFHDFLLAPQENETPPFSLCFVSEAPTHQPSNSENGTNSGTRPKSRDNKYCYECRQIIRGRWLRATKSDHFWHPEHFVCVHCRDSLENQTFKWHDNKPFCKDDFNNLFLPKCFQCRKPLIGEFVTALGRKYHRQHFQCTACNKQIKGRFFEKNGHPYCKKDYEDLFIPREICSSCNSPINPRDDCIETEDKVYHSNCFTCSICYTPIEDEEYYENDDGRPVCEAHADI